MARGRGRGESKAQSRAQDRILAINSGAGKYTTRSGGGQHDAADIYQELLNEAVSGESGAERPLKRRRVGNSRAQPVSDSPAKSNQGSAKSAVKREAQVITVSDSERSDESDVDWEEVGFDQPAASSPTAKQNDVEIGDVSVEVGGSTTPKKVAAARRKPATTAEKLIRIAAHKSHVLLLLFHVHIRNAWCHSRAVEAKLRPVLSPRIIGLLNPKSEWPQLRRSDSLMDGLKLAVDLWRAKFNVTDSGMQRSYWLDDDQEIKQRIKQIQHEISSVDKSDFVRAAATLRGSQDVGNQLFCALLRAVGVEARLVCSLQPLPLATAGQKGSTPQKQKPVIYADADSEAGTTSAEDGSTRGSGSDTSKPKIIAPRQRRRIGQPSLGGPVGTYQSTKAPTQKKKVRKQDYPVFWIEVFNPPYQKWFPVDATVTCTVSKANKLEPPLSNPTNNLVYAIAFEEDGTAHDVTRRYARSYNAKTLKQRIESTSNGAKWFSNALRSYRRHAVLDRDQVENSELARKEASEGLPASVADFKNHPYYALERHLKRHEVIAPKREVGKINAGKAAGLEPVYRRSDVQIVRSADKWYRLGREIKGGQQALKHVAAPKRAQPESDDEGDAQTALYSFSQTELYVPPPVVNGRVPRNGFGNLDIYVPSMIPAGGTHIRHQLAAKAARLLGIDFVDAVTGFTFKGRHGTAVVAGVVVASQYKEAVENVIAGFEQAAQDQEDEEKSLECLRLWKRFLTGLRIAKRIGLTHDKDDTDAEADAEAEMQRLREEMNDAEDEEEETFEAGGFFPDAGMDEVAQPTARSYRPEEPGEVDAPRLRRKRRVQFDEEDDSDMDEAYEDDEEERPRTRRRQPPRTRRKMIAEDSSDGEIYDPKADLDPPLQEAVLQTSRTDHTRSNPLRKEPETDHDNGSGGGFLADENIHVPNSGGSFLPDEEPAKEKRDTENSANGVQKVEQTEDKTIIETNDDSEMGGGFIAEDESIEPIVSGGLPNDSAAEEAGGGFMVDDVEETGGGFVVDEDVESGERVDSQVQDQGDARAEEDEMDDEPSDHGSLQSHDPEDDDAEPEWLV
ncbi:hypothetical protein MBLNU457_4386t1 [Dothideomycetes sp. NU457]